MMVDFHTDGEVDTRWVDVRMDGEVDIGMDRWEERQDVVGFLCWLRDGTVMGAVLTTTTGRFTVPSSVFEVRCQNLCVVCPHPSPVAHR